MLLATCFDAAELDKLRQLAGSFVEVGVTETGDVAAELLEAGATGDRSSARASNGTAAKSLALAKPADVGKWVLAEAEFADSVVGGKSLNLARLRSKLPAGVGAPASIALPFGTAERVLAHSVNEAAAAKVAALEEEAAAALKGGGVPPALAQLRNIITSELQAPPGLVEEVAAAAAAAGLIPSSSTWQEGSEAWSQAWAAICKVCTGGWHCHCLVWSLLGPPVRNVQEALTSVSSPCPCHMHAGMGQQVDGPRVPVQKVPGCTPWHPLHGGAAPADRARHRLQFCIAHRSTSHR